MTTMLSKSRMMAGRMLLLAPALLVAFWGSQNHEVQAFSSLTTKPISTTTTTQLSMAKEDSSNNNDLLRWARSQRSASTEDNVVELMRPLGLVLAEDENTGNVFVETVAPRGNAARTGKVKEGDIVTMCSATFGDQMWSTRGVGLTRVLAAIRVRAGPTVKLVVESPTQYQKSAKQTAAQRKAAEQARQAAQAKKDALLDELEQDEKKLRKKSFFGLF